MRVQSGLSQPLSYDPTKRVKNRWTLLFIIAVGTLEAAPSLSYGPTKRRAALRRAALRGAEKISRCGPTERRAVPRRALKKVNYTVYHSSGYTGSREMKAGESLSFTTPRFLTRGVRWGRTFTP